MKHDDIVKALSVLRPGAAYTVNDEKIEWLDQVQVQPSESEMEAAVAATAYQEQRRREYPPIPDQLDALWKGGADADEMKKKILAVKAKYPKP